ncbi:MAG TPA: hypothetical protein VF535_16595 [Allosphingosinicella sp.]|jgi:hypothetical protein
MMTASLRSALPAIAPAAAPPAGSEPEVWNLVTRVDSVPACQVYLDRFPQGPHRTARLRYDPARNAAGAVIRSATGCR